MAKQKRGEPMRRLHVLCAIGLAFVLASALPAAAAPSADCTDLIPKKPGFLPKQISENRVLRTIAFAHLKTASYRERNKKELLGGSFPAGDAVLGPEFPEEDYAAFQKTLDPFDFGAFTADEVGVAISSGDKRVTKAWQDCMTTRTGLMMWFTPSVADPTEAVLNLRWSAADPYARRSVRLTEAVELPPGIRVVQGKACIQRNNKITQAGCAATLKAKSAKTVFTAGVNSEDGWVQAYWAERLRLEVKYSPYDPKQLVTENQSFTLEDIGQGARTDRFAIRKEVARQGWQFVPSSVRLWHVARSGKEYGDCNPGKAYVDDEGTIRVSFDAGRLSAKAPQALVCAWYATAKVLRTVDLDAKR